MKVSYFTELVAKAQALISSRIIYNDGTKISVMQVANMTPNARLIAIGIRNRACRLFSVIIGRRPQNVVNVVNIIGRNLRVAQLRRI